ncbi:MaoC family dehydratase [Yoonia maritima]|uniref:MaoC family dehydratase n=1 Tax=Yoonia maritima TaxID=1435347 RepID=UPI000D0FE958|nr:MaoC family dehydratase [Yoonia maritima]
MSAIARSLAASEPLISQEVAVSDWVLVDQARIDAFAAATLDHQWIHTDPDRAAQTPFGGTIAHGFLTLSLAAHFAQSSLPSSKESVMGVNYGFDKIRFLAPVRAGSRLRGRFTLNNVIKRKPTELLKTHTLTIDIEGAEIPALTAVWLGLTIFSD